MCFLWILLDGNGMVHGDSFAVDVFNTDENTDLNRALTATSALETPGLFL